MTKPTRYLGLDVHMDIIAVAVCDESGPARSLGAIPNSPEAVERLMCKLTRDPLGCDNERRSAPAYGGQAGTPAEMYVHVVHVAELSGNCWISLGQRLSAEGSVRASVGREMRERQATARCWQPAICACRCGCKSAAR